MNCFCWLWEANCRFVLDSGWAQAIFSVLAIVIAYGSGRKSEWQREVNAYKLLDVYIGAIKNDLAGIPSEVETSNAPAINRAADRIMNAIERSRYIDHSVLPYATVVALTGIEDTLRKLAGRAKVVEYGFDQAIFGTDFRRDKKAVEEAIEIVREGRPRKWWML